MSAVSAVGSRKWKGVVPGVDAVDVVHELGELAGRKSAGIGEDVRRQHEGVAVLDVGGDEVIEQGPLEPRAHVRVEPVAVAGELDAALVVDQAQVLAEVDVVLGFKGEGRLFAKDLDDLVVLLAAGDDVLGRQVRQGRDEGLNLLLEVALLLDMRLTLSLISFILAMSGAMSPPSFLMRESPC